MKKVKLFIAMSLDGYIADEKGGVDWLSGHGNEDENTDVYSEFVKDIDTILMGWKTYHWTYRGRTSTFFLFPTGICSE